MVYGRDREVTFIGVVFEHGGYIYIEIFCEEKTRREKIMCTMLKSYILKNKKNWTNTHENSCTNTLPKLR